MKRRIGTCCMVLGLFLILGALGLFLHNQREAKAAGEASDVILYELQTVVASKKDDESLNKQPPQSHEPVESSPEIPPSEIPPIPNEQVTEMSTIEIDGYAFIGYLSIPDLGLELPVMAEWDYNRLKIAPCRQYGSIGGNDLVIAAHNYKRHFGRLKSLENGALVSFTDMVGIVTAYTVQNSEILQSTDVAEVENSVYDLVLYTCTYDGKERIVVGCDKK